LYISLFSFSLGCSRNESVSGVMEPETGEQGTFLAFSMDPGSGSSFLDAESQVGAVGSEKKIATAHDDKQNPYDFVLLKSRTRGITIGTVTPGPRPLAKNETAAFIPASITKVVTTALALKYLGEDFKFKTEVKWVNETASGVALEAATGFQSDAPAQAQTVARDLTIIADGDPTVDRRDTVFGGRARLGEIADKLYERGVRRIVGKINLLSVDERKDLSLPADGMQSGDYMNCYGAVAQAFNFHENCGSMLIEGIASGHWVNEGLAFPFALNLERGTRTAVRITPELDPAGRITKFVLEGIWNVKRVRPTWVALPITDAKAWWGGALIAALEDRGIDVKGVELSMPTGPEAAKLRGRESASATLFTIESDALETLIRYTNKPSNNFFADSIFKALATRHASKNPDLRKAGADFVKDGIKEWMRRNGHPEYAKEIELVDGSGLSRINRTTPRAFLALLTEFAKEPSFAALWQSLPIAGRDGTLKHRMRGTRAQDSVRAKTGTVKGAYQLAGYVPRLAPDGAIKGYVPFVILSAATETNRKRVHAFQDQLVVRMMELINPPAAVEAAPPRH
jgi:D-alanyl-D-alanine carboxypeptidase/D-alanyl-D-alanine-endopeptidase (penicillin-binding protein 4)